MGPSQFPQVPWPEALVVPPPWEGGDGNALNQKQRTSTTATEGEGTGDGGPFTGKAEVAR